jgi:myo-inositol-1(or 4)-monophosphatase
MNDSDYLKIAIAAVHRAAAIHKRYAAQVSVAYTKSAHFDFVTRSDLEAEKAITDLIKKKCPGHNIIGEENKYAQTLSPYTWLIDPLDGTSNFVHGIPLYSVSIALALEKEVIMGAVFDPLRNELFTALKGQGAHLNGKIIRVSPQGELKQSLLITGFAYDRSTAMKRTLANIHDFLVMGITGIRRLGSAALDLCYVAAGRAEGFWEFLLRPWDFAAGAFILREAGGKTSDFEGRPHGIAPTNVVATNGLIHDRLLQVLHKKHIVNISTEE